MYQFEVVKDEFRQHPDCAIMLPNRSSKSACAYDFYAPVDCFIPPHGTLMLWTDVKAHIPSKYALMLNVRSSMGKKLIGLANTIGYIDADFYDNPSNDGNIGLMLHNYSELPHSFKAGDRIAQGMIVRYYVMDDDHVEDERSGGFGSTGQ